MDLYYVIVQRLKIKLWKYIVLVELQLCSYALINVVLVYTWTEHHIRKDEPINTGFFVFNTSDSRSFTVLNGLWSFYLVSCDNKRSASCYPQPELLSLCTDMRKCTANRNYFPDKTAPMALKYKSTCLLQCIWVK